MFCLRFTHHGSIIIGSIQPIIYQRNKSSGKYEKVPIDAVCRYYTQICIILKYNDQHLIKSSLIAETCWITAVEILRLTSTSGSLRIWMGWESIDSQDFRGFLYKYRSYAQYLGGCAVLTRKIVVIAVSSTGTCSMSIAGKESHATLLTRPDREDNIAKFKLAMRSDLLQCDGNQIISEQSLLMQIDTG
jgi:hypothetical protein